MLRHARLSSAGLFGSSTQETDISRKALVDVLSSGRTRLIRLVCQEGVVCEDRR